MYKAHCFLSSLNPPKSAKLVVLVTHFADGEIEDQRRHGMEIQNTSCPHPKPPCSFNLALWKCVVGGLVASIAPPSHLIGVVEWNLVDWGWRGIGTTVVLSHWAAFTQHQLCTHSRAATHEGKKCPLRNPSSGSSSRRG